MPLHIKCATVKLLPPVAQGRVWLGSQGRQNGLVDELGGLDTAINLVKTKANIPASEQVRVVVYPGRRSLFDMLLRRPSQEDALETRVRAIIGHVPFRAWMKPGFLRLMPFGVTFN